MSAPRLPLIIAYRGQPVSVDPERITKDMFVPNMGHDSPLEADDLPGKVTAELFEKAQSVGALIIPDGLLIDCYGDDDEDGGGFILVAYPATDRRAGVTCGWRDIDNLARRSEDERADNDPTVVQEALGFIAAELNTALRRQ
jgi:hypothetical protein